MSSDSVGVSAIDSVDEMISDANALIASVYRDLGFSPRRLTRRTVLSPQAERQITRISDVISSVEQNLGPGMERTIHQEDTQNAEGNSEMVDNAISLPPPPNPQEGAAKQPAAQTPVRPTRSQDVGVVDVIDLCFDSPKSDDVILVPHIVPGVICVDSPATQPRRRTQQRSSLTVDNTAVKRDRSRSPSAPASSGAAPDGSMAAGGLQCPICMDECSKRQPTTTKCGHIYCKECIVQAVRLTHKCPICKGKLTERGLIRIYI